MSFLSEQVVTSLGKGAVADTTSETTTAVEDMAGYDGIRWIVSFGDVDAAAVLTLQPKENTASSTSSPTPTSIDVSNATLGGTVTPVITTGAVVVTESSGNLDNKSIIIDVCGSNMSKRYAFLSITATVESYEIVSIITERYKTKTKAASVDGDVVINATAGK